MGKSPRAGCAIPATPRIPERSTRSASEPAKRVLPRREVVADHGEHRQLLRRPPQERLVVALDGRPRLAADGVLVQAHRLGELGDVEQRHLHAGPPPLRGRVLAHPEQQPVPERVQVGGVARDLELADHARLRRVGEVERVERVDLAEGHDEARVAHVAHGVDPLALAEPADLADLHEPPVALLQRAHGAAAARGAVPRRHRGRRDAQRALVLGQRPLVEQVAGHLAASRRSSSPRPSRSRTRAGRWRTGRGSRRGRRRAPASAGSRRRAGPARRRPCRRRSSARPRRPRAGRAPCRS